MQISEYRMRTDFGTSHKPIPEPNRYMKYNLELIRLVIDINMHIKEDKLKIKGSNCTCV